MKKDILLTLIVFFFAVYAQAGSHKVKIGDLYYGLYSTEETVTSPSSLGEYRGKIDIPYSASVTKAPTPADLAGYYEAGQLCVCVYFEEKVCNPIVFAGTYNNWATDDVEAMAHFEEVTGFEGWYVVAVTDESEDIQGKPVQLKWDGTFSWDYQTGDVFSWTLVSGTVSIQAGYTDESNLKNYDSDEPVILISHYFKKHNTPCLYHFLLDDLSYTVTSGTTVEVTTVADSTISSIIIPSSVTYNDTTYAVTSIGYEAFAACKYLTTVTLTSTTPPTIDYSFSKCSNLKIIYIPCGTKEAYEAAGWRNLPLIESMPYGVVSVETADNVKGQVKIEDQSCRNSTATISATAQYGYHFTQWNDGNTDNPRTVQVTQDITYTAYFAPNQYTISTEVNDAKRGSVSGGTTTDYLNEVTLTATANYGYHFARWTDWNTDNPRTVQVTGDKTYTAVFKKNIYTITLQADEVKGYVYAPYQAEYLDPVSLNAYPNMGYHFSQWADGNTDNPRTVVLTCDTTFTAEFAQTFSGQCGDNLYWQYADHTLTIPGTGAMYDYNGNNMPWLLFRDTTDAVVLEKGITHIGNNAFNGCVKLNKIELPSTLTSIGANALAGCRKLYDIYSYATEPPVADNSSFANYNVNLYVPCDNLRDYQMDAVFGSFKYIQCISSTDIEQIPTDITTHAAQKLIVDGQVYILRNGKTYTLTGVEME